MSDGQVNASNELIQWLKMLALPTWARVALSLLMLLILASGVGLLVWSMATGKTDLIASSVSVLTIGLPVGLIVVALVFGDGGAAKLKSLTELVLTEEVPNAIKQNLHPASGNSGYQNSVITLSSHGCVGEYSVKVDTRTGRTFDNLTVRLDFKLEVNVKKANFVVWLPHDESDATEQGQVLMERYEHVFFGANKEGYVRNLSPTLSEREGRIGVAFIKHLSSDFLSNPAERLYFSQDLAFFIRGLLNVELANV